MSLEHDPDNYLIEAILWERQTVVLLAREKVGKSLLSLQMACSLSCGEALFGEYEILEPMQVLYIQTESTRSETIERLKNMTGNNGLTWNPDNFYLYSTHSMALDTQEGYDHLLGLLHEYHLKPRVIFVDPLYMSMQGGLTDDLASRHMSSHLRQLADTFEAAMVVNHHEHRPKKDQKGDWIDEGDASIMGSFVWKAFPNHIIHLRLRPDGLRSLECTTQRSSRVIKDLRLELVQPHPLYYRIHGTPDHMPYVDTVRKWVLNRSKPVCAKTIIDGTGLSRSAVMKSLSYLSDQRNKVLYKVNPGRRPTLYAPVNGV